MTRARAAADLIACTFPRDRMLRVKSRKGSLGAAALVNHESVVNSHDFMADLLTIRSIGGNIHTDESVLPLKTGAGSSAAVIRQEGSPCSGTAGSHRRPARQKRLPDLEGAFSLHLLAGLGLTAGKELCGPRCGRSVVLSTFVVIGHPNLHDAVEGHEEGLYTVRVKLCSAALDHFIARLVGRHCPPIRAI